MELFVARPLGPRLKDFSCFVSWGTETIRRVSEPQPLLFSKKLLQYTSNLCASTPPICIAAPSWLLSLEERETQQYTSHLYCSTPPICTAVRLPFVRQYASHESTGGRVTGTFLREVPQCLLSHKARIRKRASEHYARDRFA